MKNDPLTLSHALTLPAQMASFDAFADFVRQTGENLHLDASLISKLGLIAEELLINVIHYAYADAEEPGDIEMRCGMTDPETFCMVIQDRGAPFNPLLSESPGVTDTMDERPIGGLGIFLVRELADHIAYYRENDSNIIVLCKKTTPENKK